MMKKLLLSVLCLTLLVSATFFVSGCKKKHTHSFTEQAVKDEYLSTVADCTNKAKYFYSCSCGEKGTKTFEYGSPLGHSLSEWKIQKEATETEKGLKTRNCTRNGCDYSESENIPMLSHTHKFTAEIAAEKYLATAATCTEKAKYYYSCSCGEKGSKTFEYGEALNHSFTNYISDHNATCTKDGTKTAKCDRKGCHETDTIADAGSKLPHTFDKQVANEKYLASAATCTEAAKYYYSCICGEKGTETFTSGNPNGHTYSTEWTHNATEHWHAATCGHTTESGRAKHNFVNNVCTVCKYDRTIAVTSVSFNKTTLMLNVDEQATLSATVLPTDATDKTVVWSSSNTSIATVNNSVVTAIAKGTATITAKCGNVLATCSVTVNDPNENFTFAPSGNGYTLTAYSGNQTNVTVPTTYKGKPVTTIGTRAFYDCSQITEIVLPNTLKEIGAYTFGYCTSLNKIEIPSCTRVLDYAFSGCTALAEVTLPDGIVSLGSYLFENCTSLKKVTILSGAVQQNTFAKNVAIEEIILGKNVSSVAQRAFAACSSLKYLTMPRVDETQAFNKYYFGLTPKTYTYHGSGSDDVYPSRVNSYTVGIRIFGLPADDADWYYGGNGMNINSVYYKYDNNVPIVVSEYQRYYETTVGVYYKKPKTWTATFYYTPDSSLLKLTITNQTVSIYGSALKDCTCEIDVKQKFPVESISLVGESEVYLDEFGIDNYTVKVKHSDGFVENIPLISEYLQSDINDFKTSGEKTLSFGYGGVSGQFALTLKLHAFKNAIMDDLTFVSDGTKKSLIVKGAPDGTTITYKNNDQTAVGEYTVTATLIKQYYETKVLTATLYIRQETYKITYIINNAEAKNDNPTEYYYGKTLTLTAPASTTASFAGWYTDDSFINKFSGLTATDYGDITVYAKWNDYYVVDGECIARLTETGKKLNVIDIPEKINGVAITKIGNSAFYNCSGLTSVTIGNSVTSIGNSAFYGCSGLTSVIWNAENCTSAGSSEYPIFSNCSKLTNVTIGKNVKIIPDYAFSGCSDLTSVTIPNSVASIGSSAFSSCIRLTSVTIPNSVTSIGTSAFSSCIGLTSVTIGNSITSIGNSAFIGCSELASVTIGNAVTSIGDSAFYNCSGLTSVNYLGAIDQWVEINFSNNYANPLFYAKKLYINNDLVTEVNLTTATKISSYAFYNYSGLTSITIPDSVTSIGYAAFEYCRRLTSVTIGNGVTSIGDNAFWCCGGLTSITIPDSVTSIGELAFYNCRRLTSVTIGNGVTSIGAKAFRDCSGLTSVTIGNAVTSIGNSAFSGCSGLTSVTIGDCVTSIGDSAFV